MTTMDLPYDDPTTVPAATVGEVMAVDPVTVSADSPGSEAARRMAGHLGRRRRAPDAVRRLPVVQDGRLVGVVSLGDLAMDRDPALGPTSAPPIRISDEPQVWPST